MELDLKLERCINCLVALTKLRGIKVKEMSADQMDLLKQWVDKNEINDEKACSLCYKLIENAINNNDRERKLGVTNVCIPCGSTTPINYYNTIEKNDPAASQLLEVWNLPQGVCETSLRVCNPCFSYVQREMKKSELTKMSEIDPGIATFQNLRCLPNTSQRCAALKCTSNKRRILPHFVRQNLTMSHKVLAPQHARICDKHIKDLSWVPETKACARNTLTAEQVEEVIALTIQPKNVLNFELCETMSDDMCKFWTGMKVVNFLALHDSVQWEISRNSRTALAVTLIKLRTKCPLIKVGDLFGISKNRVSAWIDIIKKDIEKADCLKGALNASESGVIDPLLMYEDSELSEDDE